jgi:hypothetical protein
MENMLATTWSKLQATKICVGREELRKNCSSRTNGRHEWWAYPNGDPDGDHFRERLARTGGLPNSDTNEPVAANATDEDLMPGWVNRLLDRERFGVGQIGLRGDDTRVCVWTRLSAFKIKLRGAEAYT